jgi:hypothetical protein
MATWIRAFDLSVAGGEVPNGRRKQVIDRTEQDLVAG